MHPEDFRLDSLQAPGRHAPHWVFSAAGHEVELQLLIARGAQPGLTLVVTAGVHGDEFEGVRAIWDTYRDLDTAVMKGNFVALPVANPPAFWHGARTNPLDGGNLARVFPGVRDGTPTQAIAYWIDRKLIPLADLYLDLHSGGVKWSMPTLVGYHDSDAAARDAALIFGAPVVWRHSSIGPGRTLSAAIARGIPALYCEARGSGRIDSGDLLVFRRGIGNLLRHLAILPGNPTAVPAPLRLCGDGNIDASVSSMRRGFLAPSVDLLERVTSGQELGTLLDLAGEVIERFTAPCDGVVALIHAFPMVQPGEPLFLITGADE